MEDEDFEKLHEDVRAICSKILDVVDGYSLPTAIIGVSTMVGFLITRNKGASDEITAGMAEAMCDLIRKSVEKHISDR